MASNDIFRLRVYQTLLGGQVVNVMHFVQNDVLPADGSTELANDFITNMTTTLKARASASVTFNYVEVQKIVPFAGGPAIVNFPGGTVGGVAGSVSSGSLAEVLTLYSQRGGRRGRGRLYLPPPDTGSSNAINGAWTASQTARTQAFATAMMNRYNVQSSPSPWSMGVWSRASGPEFPPWSSDQFARVTGITVRTTIRNQRRRQLGVGR